MSKRNQTAQRVSLTDRVTRWVVRQPRLARIILVTVLALAVTLSLSPMIDSIYFDLLFDSLADVSLPLARMLPSFITAVIGFVMYGVGWLLIIGWAGETPEARRAIMWYLLLGLLALLVVIMLIVRGVTLVNWLMD